MKAKVMLGYAHMIMSLEDATVLIRTLENVELYETDYVSGQGSVLYLKPGAPQIEVSLLTDDDYAVAKMRGPKEK